MEHGHSKQGETEPVDAVVIGAGPAGLFCALTAAALGARVRIIEKNAAAGAKLLLTGNGRCNITSAGPIGEFPARYGGKARFVAPALLGLTNTGLARFFASRGLETMEEAGGRIFPRTGAAGDVLKVLLGECAARGVSMRFGAPALSVSRAGGGFEVRTAGAAYGARCAVIATGGRSYPATGSTGDGYALARALGHSLAEPAPALVPVLVRDHVLGDCAGISLGGAGVALQRSGQPPRRAQGDVLLTHRGLSGPAILDLSRYARSGDVIALSPLGALRKEEISARLAGDAAAQGRQSLRRRLAAYGLPARFASRVLELCRIPAGLKTAQLDRVRRAALAELLSGIPFTVESTAGFDEAMVTRGGVRVDEIRRTTLESRLVPGLFFAGEVIDVDGDSGGYNLQFAFSSGALAGRGIVRRLGGGK